MARSLNLLTPEGEVTARLLRLNHAGRVAERRILIAAGRYYPWRVE